MSYKKIQTRVNKILEQMDKFNKLNKKFLYREFKNKYDKEFWFTLLYFSQFELTKNIQTALSNKNPIAIPILVRSSLDLLVQMKMCNNDFESLVSNFKRTFKKDLNEYEKNLKKYKKYLSNIKLEGLSKSQLITIATILNTPPENDKELSSYSMKKLLEADKRQIAKLEKHLDASYAALCDHVHNNYLILAQRHAIKRKGSYVVSSTKRIDDSIIYYSIYVLTQVLILTYEELIRCIHLPNNRNLKDLMLSIYACQKSASKYLDNDTCKG